jgi:hypothetical protein
MGEILKTILLTVALSSISKNKIQPMLLSSSVLEYKTLNCTPKWTIFLSFTERRLPLQAREGL